MSLFVFFDLYAFLWPPNTPRYAPARRNIAACEGPRSARGPYDMQAKVYRRRLNLVPTHAAAVFPDASAICHPD